MKTVKLEAQKRDVGIKPRALRQQRKIPAVFYGQGEESIPLQMDYQSFRQVYLKVGSSQLIDLSLEGQDAKKVLVHDMQLNPLTGAIEHVDFLMVNLKEKITAHVPLLFEGEAPAIKDLGGILNTVKDEITVKCLPLELPHDITVDISGLIELHSAIHISDITPPSGVEFMDNPEDVIVIVNAPRVEEEPVAAEAALGEGEEGAAPAEGEAQAEEGTEGGEGEKKE